MQDMAKPKMTRVSPLKKKRASEPKDKGGRPTVYRKEFDGQVYKLCLLNAIDADIAAFFGVNVATLNRWKRKYDGFRASIKLGKRQADAEIGHSLYQRAKGYSHPEDKIITVSDGGNCGSHVEIIPTTRHYPPDTAAICFWLKNRAGWRDKHDYTVNPSDELNELLGWVKQRNEADDGHTADT